MGVGHQHPGQTLLGLYVGTLKRVNNRIIRNCSDDIPCSFTSYRWCAGEPPLLSLLQPVDDFAPVDHGRGALATVHPRGGLLLVQAADLLYLLQGWQHPPGNIIMIIIITIHH